MRNSKITAQEIEAREMAADKRRSQRGTGFSMMSIRDSGHAIMGNGVSVRWPCPEVWSETVNGVSTKTTSIPPGTFMIDGKLFDVDELQRYLRWV